jgi:imidazolonepropionase-like amidohydrolase
MLVIKNGKIITMANQVIENGIILVEDGKIKEIGQDLAIPSNAEVIDATGKYVFPGLIDAHTNIGLKEGVLRWEGADHVEQTEAVVPQMRPIDGVNPFDPELGDALATGVTTSLIAPGDVNVIGGIGSVFKLTGKTADIMFRRDVCVKAALGEKPKNIFGRKKMPSTRMGTAYLLRKALSDAKEYQNKLELGKEDKDKMPKRDLKLESLVKVLNQELPLHIHAHRADDIMTAIRICKEYDVKMVLVHAYEAYKVVDRLAENNIPVIFGPIWSCRWQVETANLQLDTPKVLADHNVSLALTTAHPDKPIFMLPTCASLAVREGLNPYAALEAITIGAARILGIDDIVGSLEVGKDADIVIADGHPLQIMSNVEKTIIEGKVVYSR